MVFPCRKLREVSLDRYLLPVLCPLVLDSISTKFYLLPGTYTYYEIRISKNTYELFISGFKSENKQFILCFHVLYSYSSDFKMSIPSFSIVGNMPKLSCFLIFLH